MVRAFVLLFVMALSASTVRGEWGVSPGVPSWNDKPGSFPAAGALLSLDADAAKLRSISILRDFDSAKSISHSYPLCAHRLSACNGEQL